MTRLPCHDSSMWLCCDVVALLCDSIVSWLFYVTVAMSWLFYVTLLSCRDSSIWLYCHVPTLLCDYVAMSWLFYVTVAMSWLPYVILLPSWLFYATKLSCRTLLWDSVAMSWLFYVNLLLYRAFSNLTYLKTSPLHCLRVRALNFSCVIFVNVIEKLTVFFAKTSLTKSLSDRHFQSTEFTCNPLEFITTFWIFLSLFTGIHYIGQALGKDEFHNLSVVSIPVWWCTKYWRYGCGIKSAWLYRRNGRDIVMVPSHNCVRVVQLGSGAVVL